MPDLPADDPGAVALFEAASSGDAKTVRKLLASGTPPDGFTSGYNSTALIAAATSGYAEVVQVLLEYGADATRKNAFGDTALMAARSRGHKAVCNLLPGGTHRFDDKPNTKQKPCSVCGNTNHVKALRRNPSNL